MTNEDIINALKLCSHEGYSTEECRYCPYYIYDDCERRLKYDAAELIKEQDETIGNMAKSCACLTIKRTELIREIRGAIKQNYDVRAERLRHPTIDSADEFLSLVDGKISALRGILEFMEEQDNENH